LKRKHIISVASFFIFLIGLIVVIYIPKSASSDHLIQPTIFLHGYKGTENSFGHMLQRFEKNYKWGNKALIYRVSPQGKIHAYDLNKSQREPVFIQVIFENNRAGLETNTRWLANVLEHMKGIYHINSINLVGHSMGGIVSLKYIQEYQDSSVYPTVGKLITLGSPFDGIYNENYFQINHDEAATDLKPNSTALKQLRKKQGNFPRNISVLSISSTGDMVATPESVSSIQDIIPADQLEEILIEREGLGHSALHEDGEVDQYIHSFLWKNNME